MANFAKYRMGAASITFGGVSLGNTLDGVEVSFDRSFEDLKDDVAGDTPIDKVLTGQNVTVKFKLAEVDDADNLNVGLPEASYAAAGAGERLGFGNDAGYALRGDAQQLVIHPLKNAASDLTEDITIYKAVCTELGPLVYKVNEQRVVEVTMSALYDNTYADGRRLGHIGVTNIS